MYNNIKRYKYFFEKNVHQSEFLLISKNSMNIIKKFLSKMNFLYAYILMILGFDIKILYILLKLKIILVFCMIVF